MKLFILGIAFTLFIVLGVYLWADKANEKEKTVVNSSMIQEQINNVGKLIVVEGHFSQVLNYKNTRQNYLRIFPANKKALVIFTPPYSSGA
jgi:ABC-type phosphate/phosphonate transport system ATPase subunit